MRLPYCQFCGKKSYPSPSSPGGLYSLRCTGKHCPHKVEGHGTLEGAVKAFLWKGVSCGNKPAMVMLACGCPASGCVHKFFEAEDLPANVQNARLATEAAPG